MFGLGRLGKLGSVGRALAAWTPAQLWPLGASSPGMWIDPPTTSSMFQDSAGTTAISAIGTVLDTSNPVGLVLDRKGGLALGAELVTNGEFGVNTSGWTGGPTNAGTETFVASGGVAVLTPTSFFYARFKFPVTCVIGRTYEIRGSWVGPGGLLFDNTANGPIVVSGGTGSYVARAVATATSMYITVFANGTPSPVSFDNISVKEILGIHLSQATSTSRPVASARKNELVGTAALATQNVTSKALQYVLSFWGTGSVTLSGTSTAGPLAGTGAGDRVSLTFTPTAGTLTLTVSGTVTNAQLEVVG